MRSGMGVLFPHREARGPLRISVKVQLSAGHFSALPDRIQLTGDVWADTVVNDVRQ